MSEALDEMMARAAEEGAELTDDEVEIDLSEAVNFDPFSDTVPVEIAVAALKHGKESKKPYIELKLRVFEGEYEGRILWTNLNLTGKGAGFSRDKLAAFGHPIDEDNPKVSPKKLVGAQGMAVCAPDTREGYEHKVLVSSIKKYVTAAEAEAENLK